MNKNIKILIVDDDKELANSLKTSLTAEGYEVLATFSGEEALENLTSFVPDIFIVDINLPKINGFELCKLLRKENSQFYNTPILMLTSRGEIEDKYQGFKAGTDDYLTKPFSIIELNLRINALLRRINKSSAEYKPSNNPNILKIGNLILNKSNYTFKKGDKLINLTKSEFAIMEYLMQNIGEAVSLKTLLYEVLNYDDLSDENLVRRHVLNLRRKIEDNPENPTIIKTVQGVGYIIDMETV